MRKKQQEVDLANAEAERLKAEAKGQAEANEIISRSLTPQLLQLKLAEMQRDAAFAVSKGAGNTVLIGAPGTPLISTK